MTVRSMARTPRNAHFSFLKFLLTLVFCIAAGTVHATTMQFIGTGSYVTNGSTVSISFAQLKNTSTNRSGTLYLKLVAVPVNSSVLSTQVLAEGTFLNLLGSNYGTLEGGASFTNISLQTTYRAPPAGTYNVYLRAYEYPLLSLVVAEVAAVGNPKTFTTPVSSGSEGAGSSGGSSGAGTLDLECSCTYAINSGSINLKAVRVTNNTGRTSGTLRLKLWATAQPHTGGAIGGYELGTYTFSSTLENGAYYTGIDVSVPYSEPPEGTWYLTMTVTETRSGQDYVMDYTTFDRTLTITVNGGSGGTTGPATASIDLLCDCSYETSGSTLTLNAYRVENNSGRTTGTLKLQLWASTQPYSGSSISGYKLGEYTFGSTLANNQYFYNISQNVTYTAPPAGTYYVTMMLVESTGSDLQVDYIRFDKTITVSGSTTSTKPIDLVCNCAYSISGANVNLTASRVLNQSGRTTGTLRLRLYATSTAYSGGRLTGYMLAEYNFSQVLANNQYYTNVNATVAYTAPQPGTWYYTLGLVETRNGSDTLVDYSTFPTPVVIAEPIPTGASNAPFILDPWNGYNVTALPARTEHYYKMVVTEAGTITIETSGALDTVARIANPQNQLAATADFGGSGNNFRISFPVTPGNWSMQLYDKYGTNGFYSIQSSFVPARSAVATQPAVYVAEGGSYRHPASASNVSSAVFGAGVTTDYGASFSKTASRQDTVTLTGMIEPEAQDRGRVADLYVVERINGGWYMRNTSDQFVAWNTMVASLVPFRTGVTLSASNQFTIMTGKFSSTGDYSVFVGYKVAGEALRYNGSAVRIAVTE